MNMRMRDLIEVVETAQSLGNVADEITTYVLPKGRTHYQMARYHTQLQQKYVKLMDTALMRGERDRLIQMTKMHHALAVRHILAGSWDKKLPKKLPLQAEPKLDYRQ